RFAQNACRSSGRSDDRTASAVSAWAEPESRSVRVDELRPGCLAEPVDRLQRRAPGRRRHDMPVEVAPEHRRETEETPCRLRQQPEAGIDGRGDRTRNEPP